MGTTRRRRRARGRTAPPTAQRFDPSQPRDEHGKWTDGLPTAIATAKFMLGGQDATLSPQRGDRVEFTVGAATVDLGRTTGMKQANKALFGRSGHHSISGDDGAELMTVTYLDAVDELTDVDDDTIAGAARLRLPGQGVSVDLSVAELNRLERDFDRAQVARRLALDSGPTDVYLTGKQFGLRVRTTAGDAEEMAFNSRSWARLGAAVDVVWEGFDELGAFVGEGDEVSELEIKTNIGRMSVGKVVDGDVETISFQPTDRDDWWVSFTGHYTDPWVDATGDIDELAEAEGWYDPLTRSQGGPYGQFGGLVRAPDKDKAERAKPAGGNGLERRWYPVRLQVRAAAANGGPTVVEGYASVTEQPYEMWDWYGSYTEVIRAGAFKKTLSENAAVQLLLNHGGLSMAYTKAGTLALTEDDTGLHMRAEVNPTRGDVSDMLAALQDAAVDEMSFAFRVPTGKSQWSPDYDERAILEVDMHRGDVSVVNFGANDGTAGLVGLRGRDLDRLDERAARALYERLGRRLTAPPTPRAEPRPGGDLELFEAELALLG